MMWNMSEKSDEVCERIIKAGLHADMLKHLSWESLSATTLKDSSVKRQFVRAHDAVLHNVARTTKTARAAFRKLGAVDVLQKFRDVTKELVIC